MTTTSPTEAAPDDRPLPRGLTVDRLLVGAAALPFVVAAVALLVGVGDDYLPVSDPALAEMLVRDVGHHPVLFGLYSRDDWSHPGPLLYYLLAPFYWATGSASIGLNLGALAINGASVLGMGLVARRRAGTAAMAATFAACGLVLRALGAEFAHDAWNCFVTVRPFGLLAFLVWALLAGDRGALPVAVFVASFLAQTHVGFVALALPLLGLGVVGLVVAARRAEGNGWWRLLTRPVLWAAGIGVVVWLPTAIDTVTGSPRNLVNVVRWFRHSEGVHTLGDGARVMTGQFGIWPEWATRTRGFALSGESVYIDRPVVPWLLLLVVAAAVVLWRRSPADRPLVLVVAAVFVLGVVAVTRTVGPAYQYRLYWTYVLPVISTVLVALAAWRVLAPRVGVGGRRAVAALGVAGVLVLTGVNVVTGARAGVPAAGDSAVMEALTPQVLAALGDVDGPVLVSDPFASGTWYARGLVLQLEKHGIDARVPPERTYEAAEHRVHRGEPLAARLVVMRDVSVATTANDPNLRLVADWSSVGLDQVAAAEREVAAVQADVAAGRLPPADGAIRTLQIEAPLRLATGTMAYRVGVFLAPPVEG